MADREVIRIRPTLLVGLGGTGGDVLLRIRRRFYEKFGNLEEFPIVSYLWIDTDRSEKHILAKEVEQFARFTPAERLVCMVKDTAAIVNRLDLPEHQNIRDWWYPGLSKLGEVVDGAGQIRPYSRLAFYKNYTQIRDGVAHARSRVRDPLNHDRMANSPVLKRLGVLPDVDFAAPTNVYLVASIAGGTGSGMLLDVAFLLKEMLGSSSVMAHLVFPGHFGVITSERMKANAYALLKELNYYQYGDVQFQANWDPNAAKGMPVPPFGFCYVYDNVNAAGNEVGSGAASQELIFETLAESVFKDFTHGKFASEKRSARENLKKELDQTKSVNYSKFSQKFPTRFQSQGFASLSVPHHRIVTACAYRLAAEVIDLWGGFQGAGVAQGALPRDLAEKALPELGLVESDGARRHDLLFALLDGEGGADSTRGEGPQGLFGHLQAWARGVCRDVERGVPAQQRRALRDWIEEQLGKERERLRAEEAHPEPERWGHYPRTMRGNADRLVKLKGDRIREWAFNLVDDRGESLDYLDALMRELARHLETTAKDLETRRDRVEEDLKKAEKTLESRMAEVTRHQKRGNLDGRRAMILEYLTQRATEAMVGSSRQPGVLWCEVQRRVYTEGARTARELARKVAGTERPDGTWGGGLLEQFSRMRGQLETLSREFRERCNYFSRKETLPQSVVLYEPEDVEKLYYPGYVKGRDDVRAVSKLVLESLERRVSGLAEDFESGNAERWREALLAVARQHFSRIPTDFHVLKLFKQRSDEQTWKNRLRDLYNRSAFWAQAGAIPDHFKLRPDQQMRIIGLPGPSARMSATEAAEVTEQLERVKSFLRNEFGDGVASFTEVPEPGEILFYQEVAGMTVNYSARVNDLRSSYLKEYGQGEALHIDRRDSKFADLALLNDAEQEALLEARRAFLLGCLFDVLKFQDGHYVFLDRQGILEFPHPLGDRASAVVRLTSGAPLRRSLVGAVEQRRRTVLDGDAEGLVGYYALLGLYRLRAYGSRLGSIASEDELDFEEMLTVKVLLGEERDVERTAAGRGLGVEELQKRGAALARDPQAAFHVRPDGQMALRQRADDGPSLAGVATPRA